MNFNQILNALGDFGVFQLFVYLLASVLQGFTGIHLLANVFLMAEPKHRCYVNGCDNNSTQYAEPFTNFTIPYELDENGENSQSQCSSFKPVSGSQSCTPEGFTNETVPCSRYVYDQSDFKDTTISEFAIICDKTWLSASSQSVFMFGVMIGAAGFGMISDRFGRRTAILSAAMVVMISSIGTAFAPSFQVFSALRFFTATAVTGLIQTGFVIALEFVGTSKRVWTANSLQVVFALGELLMTLVAYHVRSWRKLELFISLPSILFFGYFWLFPESVRWLISKGRYREAKNVILKAAKWNKKVIPDHLLHSPQFTTLPDDEEGNGNKTTSSPWLLFKTRRLRKWSLNLFLNWMVNTMVYYGLSLDAGHLSGDTYVNFAILAAVEIPAVILATIAMSYCGRRWVLCIVMMTSGIACACAVFVPESMGWLSMSLSVIAKSAITASFSIIYIYTSEIYPTIIRSTGIGLCSTFGRLGAIVAPIINKLRKVYHPIPMTIFAVFSVMAGLLALLLPETHKKQLPESIDEAERFQISQAGDSWHTKLFPWIGTAQRTSKETDRLIN